MNFQRRGDWLIGERYRIARIERPDGGMNYCVWDWLDYELIAVMDSSEKALALLESRTPTTKDPSI